MIRSWNARHRPTGSTMPGRSLPGEVHALTGPDARTCPPAHRSSISGPRLPSTPEARRGRGRRVRDHRDGVAARLRLRQRSSPSQSFARAFHAPKVSEVVTRACVLGGYARRRVEGGPSPTPWVGSTRSARVRPSVPELADEEPTLADEERRSQDSWLPAYGCASRAYRRSTARRNRNIGICRSRASTGSRSNAGSPSGIAGSRNASTRKPAFSSARA